MRTPLILSLLLAATAATAQPAASNTAATELLRQRTLAAACAQCHGTAGKAAPGTPLASLAGMPAAYLTQQMKAFKTGERTATVMHQIAKGYSDEQIAQLAAYFAAQKP
jgi:cytochrome subunit of sulfide dehydrogenase